MKQFNKASRLLRCAVAAAFAAALTAGCTKVDDTLGSNLVPDNQQMKAGRVTLGALTDEGRPNPKRYVETRLFQTDSLVASNIRNGYLGTMLSDTFGLREAGFLAQYINRYRVPEGYFGYRPIFDSVQLLLSIASYGGDTLARQEYEVYEVVDNKYITDKPVGNSGKQDTTFYLNFDPEKAGAIDASKPLFTFVFPDGKTTGPTTASVTMHPTDDGREFLGRLMLQQGKYKEDYSIYSTDSLRQWVEEFRGLYIKPVNPRTQRGGAIYTTALDASGFAVYGRTRVEEDPTLIQDTIGMVYSFYVDNSEYGNVSVNTVRHDYAKATSPVRFDIADADEEKPLDERPTYPGIYVEGMGGVITQLTFTEEFFRELEAVRERENIESGKEFATMGFSQVRLSVYFPQSDYDWQNLPDVPTLIEQMNNSTARLGLYSDYKALRGISDYNYYYEQTYDLTLAYGGYINRSRGCYVMDITGYMQGLWNSYLKEVDAARDEGRAFDIDRIAERTVYLAAEAYDLYTTSYAYLQGMNDGRNNAPVKLEITYNMIK